MIRTFKIPNKNNNHFMILYAAMLFRKIPRADQKCNRWTNCRQALIVLYPIHTETKTV